MTLREQIGEDLGTFINTMEFAEVRTVDGAEVACVLDDDLRAPTNFEGVFASESLLHVRKVDLPAVPVITQRMVIDERQGNVVHVDEAMGLLSIRLRWFES